MKQKLTDILISYLIKGGVLLETKGEFETEINIPIETENLTEKTMGIRIKCNDLSIRTIKVDKTEA